MEQHGPSSVKTGEIRAEKSNLFSLMQNWASYAHRPTKWPRAKKRFFAILDELAPQALAKAKVESSRD